LSSFSFLPLPTELVYAGTGFFAATGAMAAARRRHDIVTFVFFAAITGLGGGTLRDLLLGQPMAWVLDPAYLAICVGVAAAVWVIGFRDRAERLLLWPDAIGLAAFAVLGARKALSLGVDPIVSILMGVLTAAAGGIIRDITAGEPSVLLQRQIYVSAALLAAATYVVLAAPLGPDVASLAGFAAGAALRIAAMLFGWSLPAYSGGLLGRGAARSSTADA
jgi:uncharacterized membrane protein YeiH